MHREFVINFSLGKKKIAVGCSLLICFFSVFSQCNTLYKQYAVNAGLESNKVYYLYLAKNGLCYVGHSAGLSRWDGGKFQSIQNVNYPYTGVSNIEEDDNGTIYCKAFNGQVFCITDKDTLVQKCVHYSSKFFRVSIVNENRLIGISKDTLIVEDIKTTSKKYLEIDRAKLIEVPTQIIYGFLNERDHNHLYFLAADLNIYKIKRENCSYVHQYKGQLFLIQNNNLRKIEHINTGKTIYIRDSSILLKINFIQWINNIYWVSTTLGVYVVYPNGEQKWIVRDVNASSIQITHQGNVLVGTLDRGIIAINKFNAFNLNLQEIVTLDFRVEDKKIFIKSKNNSEYIFSEKDNFKLIQERQLEEREINLNSAYSALKNQRTGGHVVVKDFCAFENGYLIAVHYGLLFMGNPDKAGWLSSELDRENPVAENIFLVKSQHSYVSQVVYIPSKKKIYILNYGGIFEISPQNILGVKIAEPFTVVSGLFQFKENLYLLTKNKSIVMWNGKGYEPALSMMKGVFLKKVIYKDEIWLQTLSSLYCLRTDRIDEYTSAHGLRFMHDMIFKVSDSFIYNFIDNSLQIIPRDAKSNYVFKPSSPEVFIVIRKVSSANDGIVLQSAKEIAYNNNNIVIDFSLVDYLHSDKTHLAYSINGGKLFHLSASERRLILNNLESGKYEVSLFAIQDNQILNKSKQSVFFTVTKPFYRRWWFYSLVFIFCLLMFYFLLRIAIGKLKQDQHLKESKLLLEKELDKSLLASIKSQMNPHFIFNALNTIQSYIYKNDKVNASNYISKFSKLTRNILSMSSKEYVSLAEEIEALSDYLELEKMRFVSTFEYKFTIDPNLDLESITIPSMLLQPYVENAIKHGLLHKKINRKLELKFLGHQEKIEIQIIDNGIGRAASALINKKRATFHNSFAMDANLKRLEILKHHYSNIQFEIIDRVAENGIALGTTVLIHLPNRQSI